MDTPRGSGRREAIVDAAFTCMARQGYDRTSTARICAAAGVSSGTFFHYFPTKAAVLLAVVEVCSATTRNAYSSFREVANQDAAAALSRWRDHVIAEAADPDLPGFAAVLGTVSDHARVTEVLAAEQAFVHGSLTAVAAAGQQQGRFRTDMEAGRLANWLLVLSDGILSRAVEVGPVETEVLREEFTDIVDRVLNPASSAN